MISSGINLEKSVHTILAEYLSEKTCKNRYQDENARSRVDKSCVADWNDSKPQSQNTKWTAKDEHRIKNWGKGDRQSKSCS